MRRLRVVTLIIVAMLAAPQAGVVVARQEGAPPAAAEFMLPEGVTADPLASASTEAVPPAPAVMELVRFTFEPGAVIHLPEQSPSTALVLVESGTLTAEPGPLGTEAPTGEIVATAPL